jgi:hypothetical protein
MSWLIEKEYINTAFGYKHKGVIVDYDGNVYHYSYNDNKITLSSKLSSNNKINYKIPEQQLIQVDNLIDVKEKKGLLDHLQYSSPKRSAYDAGSTVLYIYVNGNKYKLDTSGNYSQIVYGVDELKDTIYGILEHV